MPMKILYKDKAVLVKDDEHTFIIISDLHLGDESEDVNDIINRAKKLVKTHKADYLIVDGDMFDFHIGGENVDLFDESLGKVVNVELMQGNHDPNFFEPVLATTNYCFCHGDIDYLVDKNLILGHTHPFFNNNPVYLKGTLKNGKEFVVLPPFSDICGGPDVKKDKSSLVGFIFQRDLIKTCEVFDLAGKKIAELKF